MKPVCASDPSAEKAGTKGYQGWLARQHSQRASAKFYKNASPKFKKKI